MNHLFTSTPLDEYPAVEIQIAHREGCVPVQVEREHSLGGVIKYWSCANTSYRYATLCGVNYQVMTPWCMVDYQAPLRDVAEFLAERFGFKMGDRHAVARLWERFTPWEDERVHVRETKPTLYAVMDRVKFIEGGYARAYYDLDLVAAIAAGKWKLAICRRCGTDRNRRGQKWRPYTGRWDREKRQYQSWWFCSIACKRHWEEEWHAVLEARDNVRKLNTLINDPKKLAKERQSSFTQKQSSPSPGEGSKTAATVRS